MKSTIASDIQPGQTTTSNMNATSFLWLSMVLLGLFFTGCVEAPPVVSKPAAPVIQQAYVPPPPMTPAERMQKEATQRETDIANAKTAAARDPLNWRVFNELGAVYYKQGMYDQAIAAFQQALALHPITNVIEAERKQEDAIAAQQAAQEAQRQAAIQQAKDQADKQQMGDMLSLIGGIASMKGNMGAQLVVNTMTTVNQSLNSSAAAEVPAITSAEKAESSLKDKREVASIYANLGVAYFGKKSYPQAVAAFDNVTQLDPSRMEVLKVSAEAQYNLCQYEDCTRRIRDAVAPVRCLPRARHGAGGGQGFWGLPGKT